ncbi:glycosyl transferase family 2 [Polaribacter porphyrae]|uniref:Glycosyl transferase family 2 n=1 Tax=Polaribacter porphyrae TaxID=1137780 RepID=A0A2S7WPC3_9FLAO|nr:glycosyltransferase [Polaribacter porphyrae]PQJ79306.1 glycosyl transferase family 2 [Polaribacter porphyrae]
MPVLNNLTRLKKTIDSIKNQTFRDYEVFVIDGYSDLKTQEFLQNLTAPFFYQSEKDKGVYDAMNKGISLSKGEWLFFLGAGDEFFNDATLEDIFKNTKLEKNSIITGNVTYKAESKPFVYSKYKTEKKPIWSYKMWFWNGLHHQGTFYKRELFLKNQYCLKYKTLSDYHLNLRLYKEKKNCKILNFTITKCNSDGLSKSGKWDLYKEEIELKTNLSSSFYTPFFYLVAGIKFITRKIVNGR